MLRIHVLFVCYIRYTLIIARRGLVRSHAAFHAWLFPRCSLAGQTSSGGKRTSGNCSALFVAQLRMLSWPMRLQYFVI